jgi:hypothetical protein
MSTLLVIWAWLLSHPYLSVSVATALASLGYKKLDAYPRGHAFLSLLAGLGWDLPTIEDAIRRLIAGSPPPPPKMGPYRSAAKRADPDATQDPPVAARTTWAVKSAWIIAFSSLLWVPLALATADQLACTPAAVAVEQVVANIADGACTQLDAQPEPGWVYFVCSLVQAADTHVTSLTVKVPADQAPKFAAAHPRAQVSDELAARLKGVEHLALPPKGGK